MTPPDRRPRRPGAIDVVPILVAVLFVGALVATWATRATYPYDLEWMEGGMLGHAWRIAQGEPLYVHASPEFVPFIYPPGYPSLVAALGSVVGLSPTVGRLVSIAGTLLATGALAFSVYRPTRDPVIAGLSAASFLGCYAHAGAFFDLVRPDGLLIGLLGASIAMALVPGRATRIGSAVFLVLAFLVKHNAAFFGPALLVGIAVRDGRRGALEFGAAAVLPALVAIGVLQTTGDGLFLTYLVQVPNSHPLVWARFFPGAALEMAEALPLTTAAAALWLLGRVDAPRRSLAIGAPLIAGASLAVCAQVLGTKPAGFPTTAVWSFLGITAAGVVAGHAIVRLVSMRRQPVSANWVFGVGLAATAAATATWMRAHSGGFLNVHIPFFWIAALAGGIALGRVAVHHRPVVVGLFTVQLLLQAWATPFDRYRPTEADRDAGDRVVETLKRVKGPVWSPYAAWLPTYAGHEPQAHLIAVTDIDFREGPLYADLEALRTAVETQHWGAILTSQRNLPFELKGRYRVRTKLHHGKGVFAPKSGWAVQLEAIQVPD